MGSRISAYAFGGHTSIQTAARDIHILCVSTFCADSSTDYLPLEPREGLSPEHWGLAGRMFRTVLWKDRPSRPALPLVAYLAPFSLSQTLRAFPGSRDRGLERRAASILAPSCKAICFLLVVLKHKIQAPCLPLGSLVRSSRLQVIKINRLGPAQGTAS